MTVLGVSGDLGMLFVGGVLDAVFCGVDCVSMFVGLWFLLYDFFLFGLW